MEVSQNCYFLVLNNLYYEYYGYANIIGKFVSQKSQFGAKKTDFWAQKLIFGPKNDITDFFCIISFIYVYKVIKVYEKINF